MSIEKKLKIFKVITNFITELNEMFGKTQKSLSLYARLITKTNETYNKNLDEVSHFEPIIQKHNDVFKKFCMSNNAAILSKDTNKFTVTNIAYSERVYINISNIFKICDSETREMIWKYLLTITALIDSTSKAKQVLLEEKNAESDFLNNLINKVEENINPDITNPGEAVTSLLTSGILTDVISSITTGFSNGDLDMSKLMNTMQKMMSTCSSLDENDKSMDMLKNMMSTLNTTNVIQNTSSIQNITENPDGIENLPQTLKIEQQESEFNTDIKYEEPLIEEL